MTTVSHAEAERITTGQRVARWPRWRFDGHYWRAKGAWNWNEGEFPNFCLRWRPRAIDFVYVALAPGLRFAWCRKPPTSDLYGATELLCRIHLREPDDAPPCVELNATPSDFERTRYAEAWQALAAYRDNWRRRQAVTG